MCNTRCVDSCSLFHGVPRLFLRRPCVCMTSAAFEVERSRLASPAIDTLQELQQQQGSSSSSVRRGGAPQRCLFALPPAPALYSLLCHADRWSRQLTSLLASVSWSVLLQALPLQRVPLPLCAPFLSSPLLAYSIVGGGCCLVRCCSSTSGELLTPSFASV